jgi:hypothetical protein
VVVGFGDDPAGLGGVPAVGSGERVAEVVAGKGFVMARIETGPPCGSVARHCVDAGNSAGSEGARLDVDGCPAFAANDLVFVATGLPARKLAVLSYGDGLGQATFGNGWTCLAGSVQIVPGSAVSSVTGAVSMGIDLTQPPFSSGPNAIQPGSARSFQLAYRDPAGGPPATFNFTDALHLVFGP